MNHRLSLLVVLTIALCAVAGLAVTATPATPAKFAVQQTSTLRTIPPSNCSTLNCDCEGQLDTAVIGCGLGNDCLSQAYAAYDTCVSECKACQPPPAKKQKKNILVKKNVFHTPAPLPPYCATLQCCCEAQLDATVVACGLGPECLSQAYATYDTCVQECAACQPSSVIPPPSAAFKMVKARKQQAKKGAKN